MRKSADSLEGLRFRGQRAKGLADDSPLGACNESLRENPMFRPTPEPEPSSLTDLERELSLKLGALRPIVAGCRRRMGVRLSESELDDVVQETGMAAWRARDKFRGDSDLETWLYGIARNMILRQMRQGHRVHYFETDQIDRAEAAAAEGPGPATQADTGLARAVRTHIRSVGTTAAAICRLRAVDGRSFAQIGRDMHLSEARVKSCF